MAPEAACVGTFGMIDETGDMVAEILDTFPSVQIEAGK